MMEGLAKKFIKAQPELSKKMIDYKPEGMLDKEKAKTKSMRSELASKMLKTPKVDKSPLFPKGK